MPSQRVELEIRGGDATEGRLLVDGFVSQLGALRTVLQRTDKLISAGRITSEWEVTHLRSESPALVRVEARLKPGVREDRDRRGKIVGTFFEYLEHLNTSTDAPEELNRTTLEAYRDLGTAVRQEKVRTVVRNTDRQVEVRATLEKNIDVVLGPKDTSKGSLKGRLEYVNIHGDTRVFKIYPPVGPSDVRCTFPSDLIDDVRKGLGATVRVFGTLTFPARSKYPSEVAVDSIEVLPPADELPSLLDLKGAAPDALDDESSEEYIRRLRDEW